MRTTLLRLAVAAAVAVLAGTAVSTAPAASSGVGSFRIVDLGTLGGPNSGATAVSPSGQIVGASDSASGVPQAFSWTESGGMIALPSLARQYKSSAALGISPDGVVVGSSPRPAGNVSYAVEWAPSGEIIDLGTDDLLLGQGSSAAAISPTGEVVGEWTPGYEIMNRRAFLLRPGTDAIDLGTLGGSRSEANAISPSGTVAGSAETNAGQWHAFTWTRSGGMVDLGTLGGSLSAARAISPADEAVGTSETATGTLHACRWTSDGVAEDLGTLGGDNSWADGISPSGVIVGYSQTATGATHAFEWTRVGGMVDLGTLGGNQSAASAIAPNGTIVGTARNGDGQDRAVMWVPSAPQPPTPAPHELAPNPGFEQALEGSWYGIHERGGDADFRTSTDAHSGTVAALITASGDSSSLARYLSDRIPVTGGQSYRFSAYLRAQSVDGEGRIDLTFWDANGTYIPDSSRSSADYSQTVGGSGSWTKVTVDEHAPDNAATARLEIRLYGTGTLTADDVSLTETD